MTRPAARRPSSSSAISTGSKYSRGFLPCTMRRRGKVGLVGVSMKVSFPRMPSCSRGVSNIQGPPPGGHVCGQRRCGTHVGGLFRLPGRVDQIVSPLQGTAKAERERPVVVVHGVEFALFSALHPLPRALDT